MNRSALPLAALSLLCLAVLTTDRRAGAATDDPPYVVVDPGDLRQPIPDPELGLTEKYDGKLVRFTGALRRWSLDKKTKKLTFELQHDIVKLVTTRGKQPRRVREETIVVPVTFRPDDRLLRARQPGLVITVEGKASVMTDGALVITEAVVVPAAPPTVRPAVKK
jgi:hypothetical protein